LVRVSSNIVGAEVSVSSVERRAERHVGIAKLDVPSSACEGVSVLVDEVVAEDETRDEAGDETGDEAKVDVVDEVEVVGEVEDGGLPIAAFFVT